MRDMNILTTFIEAWGEDKGILPNPDATAQFFKTQEEVDELYAGIRANDKEEVKDAIGDIYVTLVMQCGAWDLSMAECVEHAYNSISRRTGYMENGVFIKTGTK